MANPSLTSAAAPTCGPRLPLIAPADKQSTLAAFADRSVEQLAQIRGVLPPTPEELFALPFVEVNEQTGELSHWSVDVTGDERADFAQGRRYAVEALRFMAENNADVLPALILRDVFAQAWTLVAAGFVRELVLCARQGFFSQSNIPCVLRLWSEGEERQWH